jgi:hypothetical protein
MVKKILSAMLVLCAGLSFNFSPPIKAQTPGIEAGGTSLWDYLKRADYRAWNVWPGTKAYSEGHSPHGPLLTTYVNEIALKAITDKAGSLPNGSIIVTETHSPQKQLMTITVMYKVKGYNPEAGDWFWARCLPGGRVAIEGKAGKCISCHQKAKDNDFVMKHPLK